MTVNALPVGWMDSPAFDAHLAGRRHPERPERLAAIREGIARENLEARLLRHEPGPIDEELLQLVHSAEYVATVRALCASGGGRLDPDTAVIAESWEAALRAAGAAWQATQKVLDGAWRGAFCSVRPPGHHALPDRAMGFCLFDNIAIAAAAAIQSGRVSRIAILDWDVHHGNGTQDIFWRRADVMYASIHQYPCYPGTGALDEVGEGDGVGTTVNCPQAPGSGDAAWLSAWRERIRPAFEAFAPELLLISAGFDADRRDPLAAQQVTARGFEALSADVLRWADTACGGRVVSMLEGGYDLEALSEDVAVHLATWVG